MRVRIPSSTAGEGLSSSSFWWRRWIEHSRSPRGATFPCRSARSWISVWRGPPRGRLDEEREAELLSRPGGDERDAGRGGDPPRLELVAGGAECVRRRPDPDEARRFDGHREGRALREGARAG